MTDPEIEQTCADMLADYDLDMKDGDSSDGTP